MHLPFDSVASPSSSTGNSSPTRRTALERLALGVAGFFGLRPTAQAEVMPRSRRRSPQFEPPPTLVDLTNEQLQSAWDDLADPAKAQATVRLLAAGKQTVSLLSEHMKPGAASPEPARIDRFIEELQSTRFATRQRAAIELEKLGPAVERALLKVLDDHPPLEVSRRIEAILACFPIVQDQFRNGLQALALLASPDALALLVALNKGHAAAWQTTEAKATCELLRTGCWHTLVYGPAQGEMEFQNEILQHYLDQQKKKPPNAR